MRSVKSAKLGFGMVNVNVKLYGATDDHDVKFHQYHSGDCLGSIRYKRICEDCGALIEYGDIVKGIDRGDELVIVTDEDFLSLDQEQGEEIEVLMFVDRGDVDPIIFETTYYLDSDNGKSQSTKPSNNDKAYAMIRRVLSETDRVGIVRFVMRNKTHTGVLRVYGDVLAIHALMWSDEVRGTGELKINRKQIDLGEKEIAMAHLLVDSMAGVWEPTDYEDTYQERLVEMIDAKASGAEFTTAQRDDDDDAVVDDLMAKLEASIQRRKAA